MRAGCRCENMVFVCLFVCHSSRRACCSFGGDILWTSVLSWTMGQFWCSFQLFFQREYAFRSAREFLFFARRRHNFRKMAVKNSEKSKNRRKRFIIIIIIIFIHSESTHAQALSSYIVTEFWAGQQGGGPRLLLPLNNSNYFSTWTHIKHTKHKI